MENNENGVIKKSETSLGLEENVEAALAYVLGFLTGIIFLLLEKESEFVRFHAMQSTITFLGIFIIQRILAFIPFLGGILAMLLGLVGLVLWILGIVKAYQGEYYKFPIVGSIAENQVKR
ncbi:DUF4870 domain-containing protein [Thermococcus paralvinellae]|uniref:Uncharacterized protein n=1 Tax=Thermococcus paralvinellae TaxID=582419 RepID=W0I5U7_9EURY|nr:DUF4870 domain-containing protein [Thermococcus paralvinellae]AHF79778.1 Hypothetical protein TES1_0384 [Thermococcus paralvinellae]